MELTPGEYDAAVIREMGLIGRQGSSAGKFKGLSMRAAEEDYDEYAEEYQRRANRDEEMQGDADWELFDRLWERRNESRDDMAELLAEVKGVAHDEALAWIEGRDTP